MKELNPMQIGIIIDKTNASKSFCAPAFPYSKDSIMMSENNYGHKDYLGLTFFEAISKNIPSNIFEDNSYRNLPGFNFWYPFKK
ncbi:MAG: hypothetical protein KF721_09105 [Ignavibacteriaceae bacterium]|nr:hypothetical protein [Ignavibacteriaceae bacterium]